MHADTVAVEVPLPVRLPRLAAWPGPGPEPAFAKGLLTPLEAVRVAPIPENGAASSSPSESCGQGPARSA